jgi:peroxiredoxin
VFDQPVLSAIDCSDHSGFTGRYATGSLVDSALGLALRWINPNFGSQFLSGVALDAAKNGCESIQGFKTKEGIMKTVFLLALVFVLGFGFAQNQAAPDFTMYDTAGKIVKRSSFLGKPMIVTFWATWCETCQVEMPMLSKRFAKLKSKLVFLAVSRDPTQSGSEVIEFVKPKRWTFSHVLVNPPKGSSGADTIEAITKRYGIYGQPWSFFIDAKGITKALRGGISSEAEFKTDLAKIGVRY